MTTDLQFANYRQSGKSTTTVSYLLHYALFNPNSNIAYLQTNHLLPEIF